MTNPLIRDRYKAIVDHAVSDARKASQVGHPGVVGKIREIVVAQLLKPLVPKYIQIGTGKLTDSIGNLSSEIDVVLYSHDILPPLLYDETLGAFPIESVLLTIEVKSTSTSSSVRGAVANARRNEQVLKHQIGMLPEKDAESPPRFVNVVTTYFAFDSDLSGAGKSELDRYRETDPYADSNPVLKSICVVGQGYWWFNGDTKKWHRNMTQEANEEVIDFVGGIVNTLPTLIRLKARPRYGVYIINPNESEER